MNLKISSTALILGTGGHSRVIASLLLEQNYYSKVFAFEMNEQRKGETILGIEILPYPNNLSKLQSYKNCDFFIAIGSNTNREKYWYFLTKHGFNLPNLISRHANVDPTAVLGSGNVICTKSFVGPLAKIGNNNVINTSAIVEHECVIGNNCHLAPSSLICGRVHIRDNCFLGANSTVIDKISLSEGTTIGASSCVLKSIKQKNQTFVGSPAHLLKK